MRGAQPDEVCPRCDHHQPPSGSVLATCKQCGLTFQPKERLVRIKRPAATPEPEEQVFDAALVVAPPDRLVIAEHGDELVYTWSDRPHLFRTMAAISALVWLLLWMSAAALHDKIGYSIVLVGICVTAFFQARPSIKLRVAKHHLFSGRGMLLLSEVAGIELEGQRLFAVRPDHKRELILETSDREIAAYLGNTLRRRVAELATARVPGDPETG